MLLKNSDMTDVLYDPLNHLTQTELMEKFNLAFYEAQNLSKTDILSTFNEQIEEGQEQKTNDDYLIDYLISDDNNPSTPGTPGTDFDLDDFVEDFCQNIKGSNSNIQEFDTETFTTENSNENYSTSFSSFFVTPPFESGQNIVEIEEINPQISTNSLPPVGTIIRNNFDFNNYIRTVSTNDMNFVNQNSDCKTEFGHLINEETYNHDNFFENPQENHMVLTQKEAILNDDPLLSSSNIVYPSKRLYHSSESYDDCEEFSDEVSSLICKWENCYKGYDSQVNLVKHIEKCHVELKRGDEFTCFWENCPRKTKPFNARYKLLIHMRVHSGEKPNKCPFKGCSKAFSRLENLKIHQRSHTGERPYLCQFPSCSKSFSNSSDRAKHQRTHFDTKPYACQVTGCPKKYTDPSSLRKHVKNHSYEEQMQIKKKSGEEISHSYISSSLAKKFFDPSRQKAVKSELSNCLYNTNSEHSYSNTSCIFIEKKIDLNNIKIKQEIKNKLSEKSNRLKRNLY